jgi:hypothetical protein
MCSHSMQATEPIQLFYIMASDIVLAHIIENVLKLSL